MISIEVLSRGRHRKGRAFESILRLGEEHRWSRWKIGECTPLGDHCLVQWRCLLAESPGWITTGGDGDGRRFRRAEDRSCHTCASVSLARYVAPGKDVLAEPFPLLVRAKDKDHVARSAESLVEHGLVVRLRRPQARLD